MPEQKLDAEGKEIVVPPTETPKPAEKPVVSKLEMTKEEFDAQIADAVAQAKAEDEERIRLEEATKNGNFKIVAAEAEKKLQSVQLELWRSKALNKYALPESFVSALVGTTEDEIVSCAKRLKKDFDTEVAAKVKASEESIVPPDGGKRQPVAPRKDNTDAIISSNIGRTLGIGQVRQIRH